MKFFHLDHGKLTAVSATYPAGGVWLNDPRLPGKVGWVNRNDFRSLDDAAAIAAQATKLLGKLIIAADKGSDVWPRYDVVEAPAVGVEVSKTFNGDYYPIGKIQSVSPSLKVVVVDGPRGRLRFHRRGKSAAWVNNKCWALVPGVRDERSQEF